MDRDRAVRNVLIYTLLANIAVALAKILYGYFIRSIAMTSDGFHSFFDGVSNVVGLLGIWIASHPPDREHPYGHKKYETLFTMSIAFMIFLTCYQILRRVYESFSEDHRIIATPESFIVMLVTMAVNIGVMVYETRKGREFGSDFLIADAKHTKSDIMATIAVIVSLILTKMGYPRADPVIGVIITVLIARVGYNILKSASQTLVDSVCIDTYDVERVVKSIKGVRGCHDIRTRGSAQSIFLDLHVLVDPRLSTGKAHEIADNVESAVKHNFPSVMDIVVHIEPGEKH